MWGSHKHNRGRPVSTILPERWHRWRWEVLARRILDKSEKFATLSTSDLQQQAIHCRCKVKLATDDEQNIVEVFALVREIAHRVHGMKHHPVQILGALAMIHGWVAEMRTGEGKTLTSLMTVTLLALKGRGCHVFTANDYLAMRDCEFAKPVFGWFGLTSAVLHSRLPVPQRAECYQASVTYGSEKDFAFDFLRDRLSGVGTPGIGFDSAEHNPVEKIQNGHAFAVIDEADSILIDQASTPMIISCPQPPSTDDIELFHWCDRFADGLTAATDYSLDARIQSVRLTHRGCRKLRLTSRPKPVLQLPAESVFNQIERALAARHFFRENQEYLIIDQQLEIVDQGTGRVLPGRKWRDGLQQAIEIRAGVKPSDTTGSAARVTLQSYVKNYEFMCGMTGTAAEARSELQRIYGLRVTSIPSHRPNQLIRFPTRIFGNNEQKWSALVVDLERVVASGRATLVGTSSIVASEKCAALLKVRGLDVQVLHAKYHLEESDIVRLAGQPGRITVATNMAGRGTDIKLHPAVRDAGGLHVVLSEMNRSARIDRQMAGRAARQGDPGSYQIFVSLEDELLTILGVNRVNQLKILARCDSAGELDGSWVSYFDSAQRRFERRSEHERRQLMLHERQQWDAMTPLGLDPYIELQTDD